MRRSIGKLAVVLSVGILFLVLACGAQSPEEPATSSGLALESRSSNVKVGTKVGERVPEFTMRLTDGSTVALNDLVTEGKPVFIYFFATW